MKKNRWITFFLTIFMFFTMIGVNSYSSYNQAKAENIQYANTALKTNEYIKKNPTGKQLYLIDKNGALRTPEIHKYGQIKAIIHTYIPWPINFNRNYEFILNDTGTNVFSTPFNKISAFTDSLTLKEIKIVYTHDDGTFEETKFKDISKSIFEFFENNNENQDVLVHIERVNGELTLGSTVNFVAGQNYVYYAYQVQPGEVVYCEYQNGDGNIYRIPMVLTNLNYGNPQIPVYRACLYTDTNYITNIKFIVINHTQQESETKSIEPIIEKTYNTVWHNKVYYKTEPTIIDHKNWHGFISASSYKAKFYAGEKDSEGNDKIYDTIYANKNNNFLITIPTNPKMSGKTFLGWKDRNNNLTQNFSEGDKILLQQDHTFDAIWQDGICILVYVDDELLSSTQDPSISVGVESMTVNVYENKDLSGTVSAKMEYNERTKSYRAIVTISDNNNEYIKEINYCSLTYTIQGVTYTTNLMSTGKITKSRTHIDYHIIVPKKIKVNTSNNTTSRFEFKKLHRITFNYGDAWNEVLNYYPVSIKDVYPLFIERPSYRLEGWYKKVNKDKNDNITSVIKDSKYYHQQLNADITLYSNYIYNRDYYFYVDNYQNREWSPTTITFQNDYFYNHVKTVSISSPEARNLGHNIYQMSLEISKSFSDFYISGEDTQGNTYRTADAKLDTEYTYFDISTIKTKVDGEQRNVINTEKYADCLVGAQKLPYDSVNKENAFRFTIGVPNEINDYYQNKADPSKPQDGSQTNLGFKVIFVKKDGTCYVGFWNFDSLYRLDYVRFGPKDEDLHQAGVNDGTRTYDGFYSLTIRDDIAFNYSDYEHIIIIGVYKATGDTPEESKLVVVKATEYQIVTREEGNVDIYYQDNHIIE